MSDPYTDSDMAMGMAIENCKCNVCIFLRTGGTLAKKGGSQKRLNAWLASLGKCFYCGTPIANWMDGVMEHIIPKSKGGKVKVFACKPCDKIKKDYSSIGEYDNAITRLQRIKSKLKEYEKG